MRVLPMLFNTDMVRALLDERKTVTRRLCHITTIDGEKIAHSKCAAFKFPCQNCFGPCSNFFDVNGYYVGADKQRFFPGDILYVRETWCPYDKDHVIDGKKYAYRADETGFSEPIRRAFGYKWRPSIHMPKDAARIFLRVKAVRAERLQDSFIAPISPIFELWAEGMDIGDDCRHCIATYGNPCCVDTVDEDGSNLYGGDCGILDEIRGEFSNLWDSTVKPKELDKYGWAANPWVWVIEFERVDKLEGWPI